jgi:chemotaxis protein methyltransferase CheR
MTVAGAESPFAVEGRPDPDLLLIRDLIYRAAGIYHPDAKLALLRDRCGRRMKEVKAVSLREYLEHLTVKARHQAELIALLNEITIGETCFFRSRPQLDSFRQVVLAKIVEAKRKLPARPLRIWSAGCSTGEEPFTISIILQEESEETLKGRDFEILATDLNERSLEHAQKGIYGSYSTRYLTDYYKQKYFTVVGENLQVQTSLRSCVTFSQLNLSDEARLMRMSDFDVIFCCNVLIYFDLASKRRVVEYFYKSLLPHGYLFLGRSESLFGVNDDFRLVHLPGSTAYIRGIDAREESRKHDY